MVNQAATDRDKAVALAQSMRGQFIISQALCLAIRAINSRPEELQEPSNVADMEFLVQQLFPIYRVVELSEDQYAQLKPEDIGK